MAQVEMIEIAATTSSGLVSWCDIAASAYRAYAASTGNKNYRGESMPAFGDLPVPIRTAWEAAVRQVGSVLAGGSYGLDLEQRWIGWQAR